MKIFASRQGKSKVFYKGSTYFVYHCIKFPFHKTVSKNYHKLKLNYKIWIETDSDVSILGEGKWKLLTAIKETGSLKAAVESMGLSYRQTWTKLKEIEEKLGFPIIQKSRGGAEGGHTALTPQGEKIVEFFDKVYNEFEPSVKEIFRNLMAELNTIHKSD